MTSPEEASARTRKAWRLADEFIKLARKVVIAKDTKEGVTRNFKEQAATIIIMANDATPELWQQVAEAHHIRIPSPTTIEMARRLAVARCNNAIKGDNPFGGLPQFN